MSQYSDELGAWWTGFPGSDRAAWLASAPGALAPARDGVRGAMSRRALRHGLVVPAGKREFSDLPYQVLQIVRRCAEIAAQPIAEGAGPHWAFSHPVKQRSKRGEL